MGALQLNEWQEADLVRRCQLSDEEAFGILLGKYRDVLFGTAYLMMGNKDLAEDVVQEALIRIWKHISSFRSESKIKTWMVRIVMNEVKRYRRKKYLSLVSLKHASEIPDDLPGIEAELLRDDDYQRLQQALEVLPRKQKEAVVLRYFSELTVPEVAKVMGEREGTIKSRLSRGLHRLGEILGEDEIFQNERNNNGQGKTRTIPSESLFKRSKSG